MPDSIRLREYSRSGDTDGISRNSDGDPNLLGVNRNDDGRWLNAYNDTPLNRWNRDNAFAFAVPATHFISLPASCRESFVL